MTVNPEIEVVHYPLPMIEELFTPLRGCQQFTKLGLSQAYQQIELDNASKELLTVSTHRGLFRYNRLVFGVPTAPALFQKIMEALLSDLDGVVVFLDDVLVTGATKHEHLHNLRKVLKRFSEAGLTLGLNKCSFFKDSVTYLGHCIDKDGL